jgi:hypothetical protein
MPSITPIRIITTTICLTALCTAHSDAGPVWEEVGNGAGDAGSLPGSSQTTEGNGPLAAIVGETEGTTLLLGMDFQDMYRIRICDPAEFLASTHPTNGGGANFDTQLWLFRAVPPPGTARGRIGNDDKFDGDGRSWLLPEPDDGSPPITEPGIYYLAISGAGSIPTGGGEPIFYIASPIEISGPDGAGGQNPVSGWLTSPNAAFGSYLITLNSVTFGDDPFVDCNGNNQADACDIATGESTDVNNNGIPDECECPADVNDDGAVNVGDMLLVLAAWGLPGGPADLNLDGIVDVADLLIILSSWGDCP